MGVLVWDYVGIVWVNSHIGYLLFSGLEIGSVQDLEKSLTNLKTLENSLRPWV